MISVEKTVESKCEFKGRILTVNNDIVELENGSRAFREVCRHPGGVAILARNYDGKFAFVKQYRYAMGESVLEIPAGKREESDTEPKEAALRELLEETGAVPKKLVFLGEMYASPGCFNEKLQLFFADDLEIGENHPDENEFLDVLWLSLDEINKIAVNGEMKDAKTLAALQLAQIKGLI